MIGLQEAAAREKVVDSYCNIGSVIFDNTVKTSFDSINAFIYRQFPQYDNKPIKHGTYIDIWLDPLHNFLGQISIECYIAQALGINPPQCEPFLQ